MFFLQSDCKMEVLSDQWPSNILYGILQRNLNVQILKILNVYTKLFIFICKLYWSYSHYVNSISPSVGAITCWQSIPLTHVSSVMDIIERLLSVVTVVHVLCDCFSFQEGFTSCCHTNAACRFGTYVSNKKPILPSEKLISFRSVTRHAEENPQRGPFSLHLESWILK